MLLLPMMRWTFESTPDGYLVQAPKSRYHPLRLPNMNMNMNGNGNGLPAAFPLFTHLVAEAAQL